MVLSRGLVISIGVSALGCTLLFLYFRNKINSVEKKVDLMFDLIQNYDQEQQQHEESSSNNLIEVSDNDEEDVSENESQQADDDSENDEEYDDDSEEVSDDEEPKLISLETTEEINLGENDIKNIDISENISNEITNLNEVELGEPIEDSLDELDDDDEEDEEETVNNEVNVAAEDDDDYEEEEEENTVEEIIDYKKLKVAELRALARDKGLSNYANLKKQPLIELLKAN